FRCHSRFHEKDDAKTKARLRDLAQLDGFVLKNSNQRMVDSETGNSVCQKGDERWTADQFCRRGGREYFVYRKTGRHTNQFAACDQRWLARDHPDRISSA